MIKVRKPIIFAAISLLATSLSAVMVEVTPTVGKAIIKAEQDGLKDTEVMYGVRGTVFLNENVGVQAAFEASQDNEMSDGGKTDIERAALNVIYEHKNGKRVRPYTLVGIGSERTHRTSGANDDSQAFVNAGAGLKFGLNDRVDVMTEAKWIHKLEDDDDDIIATVGVGVKIGDVAKKEPVKPNVPSITETSEAENAMNLAQFKKLYGEKNTETNGTEVTPQMPLEEATTVSKIEKAEVVATTTDDGIPMAQTFPVDTPQTSEIIVSEEITPITQGGYYIQMAALFEGSGDALTNRLAQKDYPYVLHHVTRNGKDATLVLVGPYQSKTEANIAKSYLKRLKSDAFVYHMN